MRIAFPVVLVLLLAGCVESPEAATNAPVAVPPAFAAPVVAMPSCENRFDICTEPSIAATPEGTLYVSSVLGGDLARSTDGGATWETFAGPALPPTAPPDLFANDAFLTPANDGSLYFSAILTEFVFTPVGAGVFVLGGIQVARSDDGGDTWPVNTYLGVTPGGSTTVGSDRQWLAVGPDGEVYVSYLHLEPAFVGSPLPVPISLQQVTGSEVRVARSDDGGETFGAFAPVAPAGAYIGGPVTVDPEGTVLLPMFRYANEGRFLDVVASTDQGATWAPTTVAEGDDVGAWFPVLDAPRAGARHIAWQTGEDGIATSTWSAEEGAWSVPVRWTQEGDVVATGPWIEETKPGEVAVMMCILREEGDERRGDFVLAQGAAGGPARSRENISLDVPLKGRGANSDLVQFALTPTALVAVYAAYAEEDFASRVEVAARLRDVPSG